MSTKSEPVERLLGALLGLCIVVAIYGGITWVVVHFVRKFW